MARHWRAPQPAAVPPRFAFESFHIISSNDELLHALRAAGRCSLAGGHAEGSTRVDGRGAELLLDAQQLVVFGEALRAARRARLDLPRLQADRQVRLVR
eukprot:scaffold123195_cov36-Phaeocystis_antarctica.AAC.1